MSFRLLSNFCTTEIKKVPYGILQFQSRQIWSENRVYIACEQNHWSDDLTCFQNESAPQLTYSLYTFYGSLMTINGYLQTGNFTAMAKYFDLTQRYQTHKCDPYSEYNMSTILQLITCWWDFQYFTIFGTHKMLTPENLYV